MVELHWEGFAPAACLFLGSFELALDNTEGGSNIFQKYCGSFEVALGYFLVVVRQFLWYFFPKST